MHVPVAGVAGRRIGHRDLALVDRVGEVGPPLRLRQVAFLRLDGVEADDVQVHVDAGPDRRAVAVAELRLEALVALRRIALDHAFLLQRQDVGDGKAEDHVGARIVAFGEQTRVDHAAGIADPADLDLRMSLAECVLVGRQDFLLQRRVDGEGDLAGRRSLRMRCRRPRRERRQRRYDAQTRRDVTNLLRIILLLALRYASADPRYLALRSGGCLPAMPVPAWKSIG